MHLALAQAIISFWPSGYKGAFKVPLSARRQGYRFASYALGGTEESAAG